MSAILFSLTGVLGLLGAPLFVVFGALALIAFHQAGIDAIAVVININQLASTPILVAIPLFTFAGYMMAESGTPQRLVNLSRALFAKLPGGLAVVTLFACAFFTAFTGASGVTIIALGGLLYPILIAQKYPEKFSLGLLTTCGSLGLLFPPSLPIILYGLISGVSVSQLFAAGVIPGLLLLLILGAYNVREGIKVGVAKGAFSMKALVTALRASIWEAPLPFAILIGIYSGYLTASEAAAFSAVYVFIVEVFIYKDLKIKTDIPRIMRESMMLVGSIIVILGSALGFTNYLIDQQVPMKLFAMVQQFISSKFMFLVVLNIFLLIVGCLMDIFSAIIVVLPLIIPVAAQYGVHPLHLGIIFLTNLEIGYIPPPVGLNLFISSIRFKKSIIELYGASFPFLILLLIALVIITYVPDLSLWLVRLTGVQ